MEQKVMDAFLKAAEIIERRGFRHSAPQKKEGPVGMFEAVCLALSPHIPEEDILGVAYLSKVSPGDVALHRAAIKDLCKHLSLRPDPSTPWVDIWDWESFPGRDKATVIKVLKGVAEVL